MNLVARVFAVVLVVALLHYGNACSSTESSSELQVLAPFKCLSDESTLAPPAPIKVGYLGSTKVTYSEREGGYILVDGDMLIRSPEGLPSAPVPKGLSQGVGVSAQLGQTWPGGIVPYVISENLPNRNRVTEAINHWNQNLNGAIQLVPRTVQNDFAYFVPTAGGCAAVVGYVRGAGAHTVQLGEECAAGNIAHEIGHIVGLDHEQNRHDRNEYITINWSAVRPEMASNFEIPPLGLDYQGYDFGSIMHYGLFAFSIDGSQTIVPKYKIPPNVFVGQRQGLSLGDINSVRVMYGLSPLQVTGGTTGTGPTPTPSTPAAPNLTTQRGLLARYFSDAFFGNIEMQRIELGLDYNWGENSPTPKLGSGTFSVRWTGYVAPPENGDYVFIVKTTDSVSVRVGETTVVNLTGENSKKEAISIKYSLDPVRHYPLVIDYWKDTPGEAAVSVAWRRPSGLEEIIPGNALMPDPNDFQRSPCSADWTR